MKGRPRSSTMAALWSARDGIAALEFALVVPVLVLLLSGAVSFGVGLRMKMEVGNAARAGAAYASSHSFDQAKIRAAAQNATALANNVSVSSPIEEKNMCTNPASGTLSSAGSATICPSTGAKPGTYVTVTTQMPYSYILPLPGVGTETILRGKAVARTQ